MRKYRALCLVVFLFSLRSTAREQVTTINKIGDRTVMCMRTGLTSDLKDCGAGADWYAYVFVGSISSVTPVENYEKKIQLIPEEVFLGAPATPLTVFTSQADCFRELRVGDRWLFYLRRMEDKPVVLDYYGNDSLPIADAQDRIETLRRLKKIGNFAILRGQVLRGWPTAAKVIENAHVTANRQSDHKQYMCITGADGRYEFPPLPPGDYKITVERIGSYQPDNSKIDLTGGGCWDLTLSRSPQARIGGYVRRPDGSPVPNVDVVLMSSDNSSFVTTQTNRSGRFTFDSQEPGDYVLGLNFPPRADWFSGAGGGIGVRIPPASLFYPGVPDHSNARVIRLASDEKLKDLDFIVPAK